MDTGKSIAKIATIIICEKPSNILDILCTMAVITCPTRPPTVELRQITAYTLSIDETDSSPTIGASGEDLEAALQAGESICAANFVPFNTILTIEGYGACRVADRMALKHKDKVDILMKSKTEAKNWGKQLKAVTYYNNKLIK